MKGVTDGFDCCSGISIFLLFSFFLFFSILETVVS